MRAVLVVAGCILLICAVCRGAPPRVVQSWIWHPEEKEKPNELVAPAATRYFRKVFDLPGEPRAACLRATADDRFDIWVNGQKIGFGTSWQRIYRFDIGPALVAGKNVIAISATNTALGPAGLIAWGDIVCENGEVIKLCTDESWKVCDEIDERWTTPDFDDTHWTDAVVLANANGGPWGGSIRMAMIAPVENAFRIQGGLSKLQLLPRPQRVRLLEGTMPLVDDNKVVFEIAVGPNLRDSYAIEQIQRALELILENSSLQIGIVNPESPQKGPRLILAVAPISPSINAICQKAGFEPRDLKPQGYFLGFVPDAQPTAVIVGADRAGLVYGSSTFIQLAKKQGRSVSVRLAKITDWPAWPLRGPRSIGVTEEVADWCAFYKMNVLVTGFAWDLPLPEEFRTVNTMLARRGITFMPECHPGGSPGKPFIFTNQAHRQALLDRVKEAIAMGLPTLGIMVDDRPNAPESPEDEAKYGPGLVGLGKAQMAMMEEVAELAGDRIQIFFCPRVYYDPYQKNVYPTQPGEEEMVYRKLVGTLPENVSLWTTQPKLSYVRELNETWGRKPFIYHNLFYAGLADMKLYFEPYPIPSPELLNRTAGVTAAGSGRRYMREWLVNYLNFAANTWNPREPVGLTECFEREYGEQATPYLVEYALGISTHIAPGIPIMADCWDQPDEWACVKVSFGFAGRLRHFQSEPEHIERLRKWATETRRAVEVDWSESGLDSAEIEILSLNARRIWLNYSALADILTVEMNLTRNEDRNNKQRVKRCIRQCQEIRKIIEELDLNPEQCGDWMLLERAQALAERVK